MTVLPKFKAFTMVWKPHVTVAAVVERDRKFLLVEEETDEGIRFNQPAGHLERGETLLQAVVREVLEETSYTFVPDFLLGIHHWTFQQKDITYLRFVFGGNVIAHDPERELDEGILAAHWLTLEEILANTVRHRSPLVLRCLEDWQAGRRYPLELLAHYT